MLPAAAQGRDMAKRMYFIANDVQAALDMTNTLLLARVEDRHMHCVARKGTYLGSLHVATAAQGTDLVHGAQVGMAVGTVIGLLAGTYVFYVDPELFGVTRNAALVLAVTFAGAVLGAWIASMIGAAQPNSRHKAFASDIKAGRILVMVDAPRDQVESLTTLVHDRHPLSGYRGLEPAIPAFP